MGCDIHMWAEIKAKNRITGETTATWDKIGHVFENENYREADDPTDYNNPYKDQPFDYRNYEIFAALADVRSDGEIVPIAPPRGLPPDVTDEVQKLSDDYGGDGHSHSWVTLAELKQYASAHPFKDEYAAKYWQELIDKLDNVKHGRQDDEIRVVFWFDN